MRDPRGVVMLDAAVGERFRAGEPDAVRAVHQRYGATVFAAANRMLSDRDLAEEVTQQTFVQAWKAVSRFDAWEVRRAVDGSSTSRAIPIRKSPSISQCPSGR